MKQEIIKYGEFICEYAKNNYKKCLREPDGSLSYNFIVPGSCYGGQLWDWDSWLTDIALGEIVGKDDISDYEKGCVLNFLDHIDENGRIPILIEQKPGTATKWFSVSNNSHKPCLAQHALYISEKSGSVDWIEKDFDRLVSFVAWYERESLHSSGLYFWQDDFAIGVDNDPAVFYRPKKSSASIYLNCLMYKELCAMARLCEMLGKTAESRDYGAKSDALRKAVREHCWDERDGCFYSVDIGLLPIDKSVFLHSGYPRHWETLIQRIDTWTCFMPLWAGIATDEEAERLVARCLDERTFNSPYGIRSLSRLEKMYLVEKTSNPSCWLGPVWGVANYMIFEGFLRYGYIAEAKNLAEKTVMLFGRDIEKNGEMHEYYDPETGEGVHNKGFQSWNLLAVNMFEWLKNNDI